MGICEFGETDYVPFVPSAHQLRQIAGERPGAAHPLQKKVQRVGHAGKSKKQNQLDALGSSTRQIDSVAQVLMDRAIRKCCADQLSWQRLPGLEGLQRRPK